MVKTIQQRLATKDLLNQKNQQKIDLYRSKIELLKSKNKSTTKLEQQIEKQKYAQENRNYKFEVYKSEKQQKEIRKRIKQQEQKLKKQTKSFKSQYLVLTTTTRLPLKKSLVLAIQQFYPNNNLTFTKMSIKELSQYIEKQKLEKIKQFESDERLSLRDNSQVTIRFNIVQQDFGNTEYFTKTSNDKKLTIQYMQSSLNTVKFVVKSTGDYIIESFQQSLYFDYNIAQSGASFTNLISRSQAGQGNDLQNCQVVDTDHIYIPKSGNCLQNILVHNYPDREEEICVILQKYCEDKNIYRQNIRYCDLGPISQLVGIKITYLKTKSVKGKTVYQAYQSGEIDILVYIRDHHFIQIKSNKYKQALAEIDTKLIWIDKTLKDVDFSDLQQIKLDHLDQYCELQKQYQNVWIFDLETFTKQDNYFEVYSCGFQCLKEYISNEGNETVQRQSVYITESDQELDAITKMLKIIDARTERIKVKNNKTGFTVSQKTPIILVAHNAARFDSIIMLQQKGLNFTNVVMKNGLMSLQINDPQFTNANYKIIDSMRFNNASLAKLCKSFKVPENFCKSHLQHNYTAESWKTEESKKQWMPYLENDVLSLSHIWYKFTQKMHEISKVYDEKIKKFISLDMRNFISIPAFAKKLLNFHTQHDIFATSDPVYRQFIQRSIRGGRVCALKSYFSHPLVNDIDLDNFCQPGVLFPEDVTKQIFGSQNYLIAFDATSLYSSAMCLPDSRYPCIETSRLLTEDDDITTTDKQFLIECDLDIPQDLKFVPISYKDTENNAHFRTGYIPSQVINDVDYQECIKFGIQIVNIKQGIIFEKSIVEPYSEFVHKYFSARAAVKNVDSVAGDMIKLLLNSPYGKTLQKQIDTQTLFTTKQEFEKTHNDSDVTSYHELNNSQILFTKKIYQNQSFSENHMGSYILSYSKRIINDFVLKMDGHKESKIYYTDTDSLYISKSDYDKYLYDVKDGLFGGKNDYSSGESESGIIKSYFIGSKQKVCWVLDMKPESKTYRQITKKITFKGVQLCDNKSTFTEENIQKIMIQQEQFVNHFVWKRNDLSRGVQLINSQFRGECKNKKQGVEASRKVIRNQAQMMKYNFNEKTGDYDYIYNEKPQ